MSMSNQWTARFCLIGTEAVAVDSVMAARVTRDTVIGETRMVTFELRFTDSSFRQVAAPVPDGCDAMTWLIDMFRAAV